MAMRTEPTDKWIRGYVGTTLLVDSKDALLFWEQLRPVPAYAFPRADVRTDLLQPSATPRSGRSHYPPHGPVSAWYDVVTEGRVIEHAAWVRDDPKISDRIVLSWEPGVIDRWLEEDEEVIVHPRDPHARVEALASSRHVRVSLGGTVLADSHSPVLLFETGLPTRYYLPREDVRLDVLTPTTNRSACPYKGFAEEYWSLPGVEEGDNVAWSYAAPFRAVERIAGRIAFYNEVVDITVDGAEQIRPRSPFSTAANRPTS
ncbi:DUF427 domain-containing protein [Nocardioides pelophilus]|uniref:DUF427 domain-containing protein n=1 Tax=Nocardioides pelophilus TaxID=2172019 RepID=UPI001C7F7ED0|nr:DUF427 domain-containing protein [Nocardioides pelophilus]